MTRVLICGAGKVGIATAAVFAQFQNYDVYLADNRFDSIEGNTWLQQQDRIRTIAIDLRQTNSLIEYCQLNSIEVIISTLLADMNSPIIETAIVCEAHYVDCSPKVIDIDEHNKKKISRLKTAFLPNCGLAPGWTGIIANHFMQQVDEDVSCQVQVGVIADEITHSLSGSAKRFMLELTEIASMISKGKLTQLMPLSDVWPIQIDERTFEVTQAANGQGHLLSLWGDKVSYLSYQTLMPVGMADKIQFLIRALRLHEQPQNIRQILAPVFNRHHKDELWVRVICQGKHQELCKTFGFKQVINPYSIGNPTYTALQISTAIGIASVVDIVSEEPGRYHGLIAQETIDFDVWLRNRFTGLLIDKDSFYQQQTDITHLLNPTT